MAFTEQDLKDLRDRTFDSYEKYRNSGIALMGTIIGLSTGIIYELNKGNQHPEIFILAAPIAIGLIQQLAHFLGGRNYAQCQVHIQRVLEKQLKANGEVDLKDSDVLLAELKFNRSNHCFNGRVPTLVEI